MSPAVVVIGASRVNPLLLRDFSDYRIAADLKGVIVNHKLHCDKCTGRRRRPHTTQHQLQRL